MDPPWLEDRDHLARVLELFDSEIQWRVEDQRLSATIEFEQEVNPKSLTSGTKTPTRERRSTCPSTLCNERPPSTSLAPSLTVV